MSEPKEPINMAAAPSSKKSKKGSKKKTPASEENSASAAPQMSTPPVQSEPKDPEKSGSSKKASKSKKKSASAVDQEELIRQKALEHQRRQAEERERVQRQQEQLARLNQDAEECEEEPDEYGDDDFEDYEDDDFEDEEPSPVKPKVVPKAKPQKDPELDKVRAALAAENAAAKENKVETSQKKKQSKTKPPSSEAARKADAPARAEAKKTKKRVEFSSSLAGLKQALDPRSRRCKEIRQLKEFSVEKFEIFNQAPLNLHDSYLRKLRTSAIKQVLTQTNEDDRTMEVQTEEIETCDQGVPDNDYGPGGSSSATSSAADWMRFLERTSQICDVLLEENLQEFQAASLNNDKSGIAESKSTELIISTTELGGDLQTKADAKGQNDRSSFMQTLLLERKIIDVQFSPQVSHLVLAAYTPKARASPKEPYTLQSLLVLWDLNQPEFPVKYLGTEGILTCCMLSAERRPHYAIAGLIEGSVIVWDLRKPSPSNFVDQPVTSSDYDAAALTKSIHASEICALQPLRSTPSGQRASFQFGSLDDRGGLNIWTVADSKLSSSNPADPLAESDKTETCRLIKGASIDTIDLIMSSQKSAPGDNVTIETTSDRIGPCVTCVTFFPSDPNEFLVGTNTGKIYRQYRFRKACLFPKFYHRVNSEGSSVISIEFNPFLPSYFLAVLSDGWVVLYQISQDTPLLSWNTNDLLTRADARIANPELLQSAKWSRSQPGMFFVWTIENQLFAYDLLRNDFEPIQSEDLTSSHSNSAEAKESTATSGNIGLPKIGLSSTVVKTRQPTIAISCGSRLTFHELRYAKDKKLAASGLTIIRSRQYARSSGDDVDTAARYFANVL